MAISFASGNYIEETMVQPPPTTRGAFSCRFKTTTVTTNACPLARHGATSSNQGIMFLINNTANKISAYAKYSSSGTSFLLASTSTINDGNWHTAICNWETGSSKTITLLIDGVQEASTTSHANAWTFIDGRLRLGKSIDGFWGNYVGDLADVTWFNEQLTIEEAAAFHKGFSPLVIKPQNVELYIPGVRGSQDIKGVNTQTISGTSVAVHSRAFY